MGLLIGQGIPGGGCEAPPGPLMRDEVSDFIPLSNVHPAPRQAFALDEAEVARFLHRGVVGVYHSHPDGTGELSLWDDAWGFEVYWIVDSLNGKIYESRRRMSNFGRNEFRPA